MDDDDDDHDEIMESGHIFIFKAAFLSYAPVKQLHFETYWKCSYT